MKSKIPLLSIGSIIAIVSYCLITFISTFFFTTTWTPLKYFLSDLGSSTLNPNGAWLFNLVPMIMGCALMLFYIGLYPWAKDTSTEINDTHQIYAQIVGVMMSLYLINVWPLYL